MRVSQRLLLTLLPAFVGLFTVVGLAYWGQYQRQAPHLAVVAAALALAVSVVLALRMARYLVHSIERLAAVSESEPATDELKSIERSVAQMKADRAEGTRREQDAAMERRELASLLADASSSATSAIDEIRLPLHILLENRFGDLNENQEEMLGSAQTAAENASVLLRRLRLTADLERGAVDLRRDPLRVDDIIRGLLPTVQSIGEARNVTVTADVAPALPRTPGDQTYLTEALALLLKSAVDRTPPGGQVLIVVANAAGGVRVTITHGSGLVPPLERALVRQLSRSMGMTVTEGHEKTTVEVPSISPVTA